MTEVEFCGGGHRTRLRDQLMCLWGAPSPVYKGGEEGAGRHGAPQGGIPTPTSSRFPPFPSPNRRGGRGRRKEGKGARPSSQFGLGVGGGPSSWPPPLSSTKAHVGPLSPRGVPVNSWYSGKCLNSSETIPVSKRNLPIYQPSCLDHFKTPRHVRDLIRDSEQPSVHQNS